MPTNNSAVTMPVEDRATKLDIVLQTQRLAHARRVAAALDFVMALGNRVWKW